MKNQVIAVGLIRLTAASEEGSGYCLGRQASAIERHCQSEGLQLSAHFCERLDGRPSGRPCLNAALSLLRNGQADILVVACDQAIQKLHGLHDIELIERNLKRLGKSIVFTETATSMALAMRELENSYRRNQRKPSSGRKGWSGSLPYEFDMTDTGPVLNRERWQNVRRIYRLCNLKDDAGIRRLAWHQVASYMNGANRLIDPTTGQRGRRFVRKVVKRSTRSGKIHWDAHLWNGQDCRLIYETMASGKRTLWQRKILAIHA